MKKIFIFSLTLFLLGCDKNYTVDDFLKENKLREEYFAKCNNGNLHPENINCINVLKAKEHLSISEDQRPKTNESVELVK